MKEASNPRPKPETAVLVGQITEQENLEQVQKNLIELSDLCMTLGVVSVDTMIQMKETGSPRFRIGTGKVEELKKLVQTHLANLVVFDGELSPSQLRNLEQELQLPVLDRTGIILQIFSQNARTYEAKLQIELASLEYALPRLKRQWTHLSRQQGGRGFIGGDGETQLEVDRRYIRTKILQVKAKLEKIKNQRETRKKSRLNFFKVAIVGYTNSGKSTLLNRMTESDVLVEDKLFATLDPSTRIIKPDEKPAILFSDTVGFIKKLPHNLVASFRSTFEEIRDSDLLVHVVDISDEDYQKKIRDTLDVLKDLELDKLPRLLVFNKIDLRLKKNPVQLKMIQSVHPGAILVSAWKDIGIPDFKNRLYDFFKNQMSEKIITVALGAEKILETAYELTRVFRTDYREDSILVHFRGATRDVDYILDRLKRANVLLDVKTSQIQRMTPAGKL